MRRIISLLMAMIMAIGILPAMSAVAETVDVDNGLILYYNFDTESEYPDTIVDSSGNGNHAKVLNTYTSEMTKELSVLDGIACFPGYGYIDDRIIKGAAIQLPNGVNEGVETFTYSAWVQASWASEASMRIFDFGNLGSGRNNPYNSIFTRLTIEDTASDLSTVRIHDRTLSAGGDDPAGFVEATVSAFENEWSLYTLVYEKNENTGYYETTVYIDGNKIDALCDADKFTRSLDDLGTLNNTTNGMFIGRSVWTAVDQYIHQNPDFKGQMDEIRLYDRALNEDEIEYLYANTKPSYKNFITGFTTPVLTVYEGDVLTFPNYVEYHTAFSDTELVEVDWFRDEEDISSSVGTYKVDGSTKYGDVVMVIKILKNNTATENGLLLYYNFEEDAKNPSKIIDMSGNGNDAKVLNNVSGSVNRSLTVTDGIARFPGMSSSALGAALKLPNTINQGVASFTYSAWIKADSSYEYANKLTRFFDFGNIKNGPRDSIFARYTTSSGLLYVQDRYLNKSKEATLSDKPFTDTWGLFTLVYEKSATTGYYELSVYVNGEEVTALNSSKQFTRALSDLGELDDSSNGMFIGRTVWAATGSFVTDNPDFCGEMDEIRLYARALTKNEILDLFETTKPSEDIYAVDYSVENVTTSAGDYPLLPEKVTVTYNNGKIGTESVTWETIPSEKYSQAGTFEATGVTKSGLEITVKVIVIKKDSSSSLNQGLVVYYNFDNEDAEPDKIIDVSGNGHDATVLKTVQTVTTNTADGTTAEVNNIITLEDGVAVFPGYTQLKVNSGRREETKTYMGAALRMPADVNEGIENFTYSAWIYADTDYTFASGLQRFFDFGNLSNNYNSFFYRYVTTSGDSRFQDRYVGSSAEDASSYVSAKLSDKPFNDKWAHLVVTYEKQSGGYYVPKVYINGEEREEYNKSIKNLTRSLKDLGSLNNSTNALLIGRTIWAANNSNVTTNPDFCGKMDEIRLYNRVLTENEIQQLYSTYKPSDVKVELDEYKIAIEEDVEVTRDSPYDNLNGSSFITVSSGNYDTYTHFGLMRTDELNDAQKLIIESSEKILLSMYMMLPASVATGEYYCYGLTDEYNSWNVDTITYGDYVEHIYGSVLNDGTSTAGELVDTYSWEGGVESFLVQFDVTEFVKEHTDDFSFLISTNSAGGVFVASELASGYAPELIVYAKGLPITVNRVDTEGSLISSSVVFGHADESYTYTVSDSLISHNGTIYAVDEEKSTLTVEEVTGNDVIEVVYSLAEDVTVSVADTRTYVGAAPSLVSVVEVHSGKYSATFAAEWNELNTDCYAQTGTFTAEGFVAGTNVPISTNVTVFPEYNGQVGGDLVVVIYADGKVYEEKRINKEYGTTFTLDTTYEEYLGRGYRLEEITGDITAIGGRLVMNRLNQRVNLYFVMTQELLGTLSVRIKADDFDETSYTLTLVATIMNTKLRDETVSLIIADYEEDALTVAETVGSELVKSRTGENVTISKSMAYVKERDKDKIVYLWGENMEPLTSEVRLADVKVEGYLPKNVAEMAPTYNGAVSTVKKANDYWQSRHTYNEATNGLNVAFWDTAAYHTGNIEAYKLTGDESYLNYSVNWANYCNWMGNNYQGAPSNWTWDYNQSQGSNAVLFGDWQTCFQTFIDLYALGVEDASLDRVYEVMDYQISTDRDVYWWWADALYMVMPVMTKLYSLTNDTDYLDALYKYFKYAKEYMYDGPGGIPTSADGYTTSAKLKNGASYADPDDYKYLFYRDSNYVYPLNPNPGHGNEKNFWSRGNGWVFAGLAKVLSDMPATYEHYDEFYNTYMEMAQAIIACQETDDDGYGFWTQSMLQNYPVGNNGNNEGYETSGTAFFTYGLFWGINNGFLDEETYLEPTLRAWGYLETVALHSSGKVGYVQPIGSNATQATAYDTTQDFGVGAYLLAACEAARYAENQ